MKYKFDTDQETRKRMSKVHVTEGKDEVVIRKILWDNGIHYRKNYKELPGKPDIAITKYKIAVFIDGEFWHGYDWENYRNHIKRNRDYWIPKIEHNMKHDQEVNAKLEEKGWTVLRFWSKKVLKNPEYYAELIMWHVRAKQNSQDTDDK
ncbi:very short patch repair endonuclease (plasmid) [Limosilactobacillus mucosae]|nr:very short patch repair endonuclease [Limosilactobacillus mucosae]QOL68812.1 very short patch repair endonuclease [Limosilactobacillus mucosae]